jgi:ATP/maltotriose-dependent transcriptional regulator MalT
MYIGERKCSVRCLETSSSPVIVQAQVLVLLAELHMRNGDYDKALQLLLRAPDLGSFLYVPEAKAIFLVRSR